MTDTASFPRSVLAYIRRHELLRPGDRVAAAVSGGADSVALLRVMLELQAELGIVLSVAHFNHKIRGEASDADEQFVRELAERFGLELHSASGDAPAMAAANKISLETAARDLRYGFFRQLISSGTVSKVMTAHTLDDQAETVLMRIMRGTGTAGLAGIYPRVDIETHTTNIALCGPPHSPVATQPGSAQASGAIIRPLLGTRRCEIEDYLRGIAQPWREDATNADTQHTRNRVRHVLLPLLESEFSGNVRQRLAELAEIARAEESDWQSRLNEAEWAAPASAAKLAADTAGKLPALQIDAGKLSHLSVAFQRRAIRQVGEELGIALDFETIDAIQRMAVQGTSDYDGAQPRRHTTLILPDGWRVIRKVTRRPSGGTDAVLLAFERQQSPVATDYELAFHWPGVIEVPRQSIVIRARLVDLEPAQAKIGLQRATRDITGPEGLGQAGPAYNRGHLLDAGKLMPELTLRNWRPGDQFWPAHTSGPKKVKELLQKQHVTGPERASWPVLLSANEIVWMRGFRVSEKYRVAEGAKQGLLIEEQPDSRRK